MIKFKCNDPEFFNLVGDVMETFEEECVTYYYVVGEDWEGTFREDEGQLI